MKFLLFLSLTGCLATDLDGVGIDCDTDDQCPSNAFCETELHECRLASDGTMPMIAFGGLALTSAGPFATTLDLPSDGVQIFKVELVNTGSVGVSLDYEITGPACLRASALSNGTSALAAGASFVDEAEIDPDAGCASPATITVVATASKREFDFDATITLH